MLKNFTTLNSSSQSKRVKPYGIIGIIPSSVFNGALQEVFVLSLYFIGHQLLKTSISVSFWANNKNQRDLVYENAKQEIKLSKLHYVLSNNVIYQA